MAKISDLPAVDDPTGDETVVVLRDGVAQRVAVGLLAAASTAPYVALASSASAAAREARDAAQAMTNYRATRAQGVADFPVGTFFCSAEGGALRLYQRIAAAPYYQDEGDGAAPLARALMQSTDGGNLVGLDLGDTAQARFQAQSFASVAAMLACDLAPAPGRMWQMRGYAYREVGSAQEAHLVTAGGCRLKVLPHAGAIWAEAFGCVADDDGSDYPAVAPTDNGPMLNAAAAVARGLKVPLRLEGGTYGFATPLILEDSGPNGRDNPGLRGAGWYKTYLVWRGGNGHFDLATTGTTALSNTLITGVASTAGVQVGMLVTGAGIQAESYVTAVTADTIRLSLPATASAAGVALAIHGGGEAIRVGAGQGNTLAEFTLNCRPRAGYDHTSCFGIFQAGLGSYCVRDRIIVDGFYRNSWSTPGQQGLFQSQLTNIRLFNTIRGDNLWTDSKGTANCIDLIYCSAGVRPFVYALLELKGLLQASIGHIGLEHANILQAALITNISDSAQIGSINAEGLRAFDPTQWQGLISSSGVRPKIDTLTITNCAIGGWPVASIVRTGNTVRWTLDDPSSEALANGGHGIAVGDPFTAAGADQAEYNGTFTVTATGRDWLEASIATTPASPGTWAAADSPLVWRGTNTSPSYPLVQFSGRSEGMDIMALHMRSMGVRGENSARRAGMARWSRQSGSTAPGATLKVHRLLRRSRDDSPWTDRRKVISATRAADGTETFEFEQAHNLCAGERIKMVGTTGGSGLTGIKTIASIVNETTITVAGSGAAVALTAQASAYAVHCTWAPATRSRSGGIVTLTGPGVLNAQKWHSMSVHCDTGSYSKTETVILSIVTVAAAGTDPGSTTITYWATGGDEAATADASIAVQMIQGAYVPATLQTPSTAMQSVAQIGDSWEMRLACAAANLPSGAVTEWYTRTLYGARVGDRIEGLTFDQPLPAGVIVQALVSASDTVKIVLSQTTGAAIAIPLLRGAFKLAR